MYDARAVANWFLDRAAQEGEHLTAMKLQKLVYVSHGWHLAMRDTPLVHDVVEAWKWGPVFRGVYRVFCEFGSSPITSRATAFDGADLTEKEIRLSDYPGSQDSVALLDAVWVAYRQFSAPQLSNITHQPGTPWNDMFEAMGRTIRPFTIIPNETIKAHYKKLLDERTPAAN